MSFEMTPAIQHLEDHSQPSHLVVRPMFDLIYDNEHLFAEEIGLSSEWESASTAQVRRFGKYNIEQLVEEIAA